MSWLSNIVHHKNRVKPIAKFDAVKSSLLIISPIMNSDKMMVELAAILKDHNVFILRDSHDGEEMTLDILGQIRDNNLTVLAYGRSAGFGLKVADFVEKKGKQVKLILLDGVFDTDFQFSTDKGVITDDPQSVSYLEEYKPIESSIYAFFAIGGVNMVEEDYKKYTNGEVFSFPMNGHHYDILKDIHVNDMAFYVSNILKGRHNLLSLTLTTQAATPNWYKDLDGRPMGEGKAPESCKKEAPFEMKKCPYPGSRHQHDNPMNVSALKQMRSVWKDALNMIRYIRDLYLQQHPTEKLALVDVWKIIMYASYLPTFMLYRKDKRFLDHCVPPVVAAVYKMFIGLRSPVEKMIQEEFTGEKIFEELNSKILHDYAEENNSFVGPDEVCGGPENLVVEFLNAFMDLTVPVEKDRLFEMIVPDKNKFYDFIGSIINTQILQNIHFQQTQYLVKEMIACSHDEEFNKELKDGFYINENAMSKQKHAEIVELLKERLEYNYDRKEQFNFVRLGDIECFEVNDVVQQDESINRTFFENLRSNEEKLLESLGYKNKVIVGDFIYNQYMGIEPFSEYYKKIKV